MAWFKYILLPFSAPYWLFTWCRNCCFNWGILHQTTFRIPTISVGNITVGGTGKTPHVQYLVQLFAEKNVASLSRGYKRQSKGFVLSTENTTVQQIGDEPFQLQKRFPNLHVAVCEKRVEGVNRLLQALPNLNLVILDDAFQHRYIKPQTQILLIDYNRPIWSDHVFPVGFLREGLYTRKRANIVIVSKCPPQMTEDERNFWRIKLRLNSNQTLFFTRMDYGKIYNFSDKQSVDNQQFLTQNSICVVSGIAQPKPLIDYVQSFGGEFIHKQFPDHYSYSATDVEELKNCPTKYKIVTTEKDVYKLAKILPETPLFVLPITPEFLFDEGEKFNQMLLNSVR